MCGINAVYSFASISDDDCRTVERMNDEMRYRGPDDSGIWSDETVCLGAVRLAIIGLGNGHQPITNETGDVVVVCNGEIYNYLELRKTLVEQGHRFSTETDIEVLVHLYEQHGNEFVRHIKGMFAFALYNSAKRLMVIGRDRLGEKPLYYSQQFGRFIVSSEAKTIAIFGDQEPTIDQDVMMETNYSSFPQDPQRTLFNEIKRILPGECFVVSTNRVERFRYWQGRRVGTFSGTEDEAASEVRRLLENAVKRTLISDVPVAVMLSGGIDSSVIAKIGKQASPNLEAITVGYEGDSAQDERYLAQRVAENSGIRLHEIELSKEDFVRAFEEYSDFLDEPIWDPASIMQWHIFKQAKSLGFRVLLSGQASDEMFFGYPNDIGAARHFEFLRNCSEYLPIGRRGLRLFLKEFCKAPKKFFSDLRSNGRGELSKRKLPGFGSTSAYENPRHIFWSYLHSHPDALEARFNYLREIYLPSNGFLQMDKLSMAHSVEVRSPFADVDLVDFVLSLPRALLTDGRLAKMLLKRAVVSLIPDFIMVQPKRGFQPSDELLSLMMRSFSPAKDSWSAMTNEVCRRVLRNIADARSAPAVKKLNKRVT
jgi:asparagine synthase (glutamine-hydrolysing)